MSSKRDVSSLHPISTRDTTFLSYIQPLFQLSGKRKQARANRGPDGNPIDQSSGPGFRSSPRGRRRHAILKTQKRDTTYTILALTYRNRRTRRNTVRPQYYEKRRTAESPHLELQEAVKPPPPVSLPQPRKAKLEESRHEIYLLLQVRLNVLTPNEYILYIQRIHTYIHTYIGTDYTYIQATSYTSYMLQKTRKCKAS